MYKLSHIYFRSEKTNVKHYVRSLKMSYIVNIERTSPVYFHKTPLMTQVYDNHLPTVKRILPDCFVFPVRPCVVIFFSAKITVNSFSFALSLVRKVITSMHDSSFQGSEFCTQEQAYTLFLLWGITCIFFIFSHHTFSSFQLVLIKYLQVYL